MTTLRLRRFDGRRYYDSHPGRRGRRHDGPVFVGLAGGGHTHPKQFWEMTQIHRRQELEDADYRLIFPEGSTDGLFRTWNAGNGCLAYAGKNNTPDSEYIAALLEEVDALGSSVHFAGMSNGAMFSYWLMKTLKSDPSINVGSIFAAAGGPSWLQEDPAEFIDTRILHVHSTLDTFVRIEGGPSKFDPTWINHPVMDAVPRFAGAAISLGPWATPAGEGHAWHAVWTEMLVDWLVENS